jgi:hypothetical protein
VTRSIEATPTVLAAGEELRRGLDAVVGGLVPAASS